MSFLTVEVSMPSKVLFVGNQIWQQDRARAGEC